MTNEAQASLVKDLKKALRWYRRPDQLITAPAGLWAGVRVLETTGITRDQALQAFLREICDAVAPIFPEATTLIQEHYFDGCQTDEVANKYNISRPAFYLRIKPALEAMASVVDTRNSMATQRTATRLDEFEVSLHTPVVGIDTLIENLAAELRAPLTASVMVIEGMGGLGKTTLALLAAERASAPPFAGMLFASAKQVEFDSWFGIQRQIRDEPISARDIIYQLASQLKIESHADSSTLKQEIFAHCQKTSYVILIDNLETAADTEAVAELVTKLANPSKIILTSRDHAPNALPAHLSRRYVSMEELDEITSIELLRLAGNYTHATQLTTALDNELARIYEVTGGNPLALWLVAGQARDIPWEKFLEQLTDQYQQGRSGYELYDYLYRRSWDLLGEDAQKLLFTMHHFRAGVTYEDLLHASGLEPLIFQSALIDILTRMLMSFDGHIYRIHRLTYAFLRVVIAGWWE